jgi:hypothetical protein
MQPGGVRGDHVRLAGRRDDELPEEGPLLLGRAMLEVSDASIRPDRRVHTLAPVGSETSSKATAPHLARATARAGTGQHCISR